MAHKAKKNYRNVCECFHELRAFLWSGSFTCDLVLIVVCGCVGQSCREISVQFEMISVFDESLNAEFELQSTHTYSSHTLYTHTHTPAVYVLHVMYTITVTCNNSCMHYTHNNGVAVCTHNKSFAYYSNYPLTVNSSHHTITQHSTTCECSETVSVSSVYSLWGLRP